MRRLLCALAVVVAAGACSKAKQARPAGPGSVHFGDTTLAVGTAFLHPAKGDSIGRSVLYVFGQGRAADCTTQPVLEHGEGTLIIVDRVRPAPPDGPVVGVAGVSWFGAPGGEQTADGTAYIDSKDGNHAVVEIGALEGGGRVAVSGTVTAEICPNPGI